MRPPGGLAIPGLIPAASIRAAVGPAGMAIDPIEPDRPVGHDLVELGCGGEAAEAPLLLVPAASDDPGPRRVVARERCDLRERLVERSGVRKIQRQRRQAQFHDVEMSVDQAGHHEAPLAIQPVLDFGRALVAVVEHLFHAPVVVDPQRLEAVDLAALVDADALDIVDQLIGPDGRGSGRGEQDGKGLSGSFCGHLVTGRLAARVGQSLDAAKDFDGLRLPGVAPKPPAQCKLPMQSCARASVPPPSG